MLIEVPLAILAKCLVLGHPGRANDDDAVSVETPFVNEAAFSNHRSTHT